MNMTEKLILLMNERELSKADVSKGADIPYTTFDGIFKKGHENLKLPTLKKLAAYFDVSMEYLSNDDVTDRNFGKILNVITLPKNSFTRLMAQVDKNCSEEMKNKIISYINFELSQGKDWGYG